MLTVREQDEAGPACWHRSSVLFTHRIGQAGQPEVQIREVRLLNQVSHVTGERARDASRRRVISLSLLALSLGTTTACDNPFSFADCLSIGVQGITATVVDASTGLAPSTPPSMRLTDGTYIENVTGVLQGTDPVQLGGAVERPGVYQATFSAEGYNTVVRQNLAVRRSGQCSYLQPVRLDVEMVAVR